MRIIGTDGNYWSCDLVKLVVGALSSVHESRARRYLSKYLNILQLFFFENSNSVMTTPEAPPPESSSIRRVDGNAFTRWV